MPWLSAARAHEQGRRSSPTATCLPPEAAQDRAELSPRRRVAAWSRPRSSPAATMFGSLSLASTERRRLARASSSQDFKLLNAAITVAPHPRAVPPLAGRGDRGGRGGAAGHPAALRRGRARAAYAALRDPRLHRGPARRRRARARRRRHDRHEAGRAGHRALLRAAARHRRQPPRRGSRHVVRRPAPGDLAGRRGRRRHPLAPHPRAHRRRRHAGGGRSVAWRRGGTPRPSARCSPTSWATRSPTTAPPAAPCTSPPRRCVGESAQADGAHRRPRRRPGTHARAAPARLRAVRPLRRADHPGQRARPVAVAHHRRARGRRGPRRVDAGHRFVVLARAPCLRPHGSD